MQARPSPALDPTEVSAEDGVLFRRNYRCSFDSRLGGIEVGYPNFERSLFGCIEADVSTKGLFAAVFKVYKIDTLLQRSRLRESAVF